MASFEIILILEIVKIAVSSLILVSVFLAYLTLKSDHEHRRRHYTMQLYDAWRRVLDEGPARGTFELIRSGYLSESDLVMIAKGKPIPATDQSEGSLPKRYRYDQVEVNEIRKDIASILNLFEQIVVADRDHVGHHEMIKDYFKEPIMRMFKLLKPFVGEWELNKNRSSWKPLEEILENEWDTPLGKRRATA